MYCRLKLDTYFKDSNHFNLVQHQLWALIENFVQYIHYTSIL